ncbi:TadE-like protein [Mumia flava]|uniref:TadE-like protein n=1 Tax=Mumia flava TaxID=1348852 RepID=A0A0B2B9F6_9ACTN|nr:TadE/TadG family type IV pilus assembly protein [Mumia flava]PJJ53571.1 TadE-like protein [Mumia flava]
MTRWWRDRAAGRERGSMAVEVVIFIPVLFMFTLLVVAGGRYVSVKGDMEAAARDAARAASFARDVPSARARASTVATQALDGFASCDVDQISGSFTEGGVVDVTLRCAVPNDGLGLIGLSGTQTLTATGSAPIDTYRRFG